MDADTFDRLRYQIRPTDPLASAIDELTTKEIGEVKVKYRKLATLWKRDTDCIDSHHIMRKTYSDAEVFIHGKCYCIISG